MEWNRAHAQLNEKQDSFFSQMFGHMTVTYLPDRREVITMEPHMLVRGTNTYAMSGFTKAANYQVKRQSADVMVIKVTSDFIPDQLSTCTMHFDGPATYWLLLNEEKPETSVREYFRRIEQLSNGIQPTK
jgi:hypothetical protein